MYREIGAHEIQMPYTRRAERLEARERSSKPNIVEQRPQRVEAPAVVPTKVVKIDDRQEEIKAIAQVEKLRSQYSNFRGAISQRRQNLATQIARELYLEECRRNPGKAKDFEEDVIDTNVELLLRNGEAFEKV